MTKLSEDAKAAGGYYEEFIGNDFNIKQWIFNERQLAKFAALQIPEGYQLEPVGKIIEKTSSVYISDEDAISGGLGYSGGYSSVTHKAVEWASDPDGTSVYSDMLAILPVGTKLFIVPTINTEVK